MVWFPLACTFDAYDLRTAAPLSTATRAAVKPTVLATLIYLLIPFLTPALPASRLTLAGFPFLLISLLVAARGLYVLGLAPPFFHHPALIIGAGWAGLSIAQVMAQHGDEVHQSWDSWMTMPADRETVSSSGDGGRHHNELNAQTRTPHCV